MTRCSHRHGPPPRAKYARTTTPPSTTTRTTTTRTCDMLSASTMCTKYWWGCSHNCRLKDDHWCSHKCVWRNDSMYMRRGDHRCAAVIRMSASAYARHTPATQHARTPSRATSGHCVQTFVQTGAVWLWGNPGAAMSTIDRLSRKKYGSYINAHVHMFVMIVYTIIVYNVCSHVRNVPLVQWFRDGFGVDGSWICLIDFFNRKTLCINLKIIPELSQRVTRLPIAAMVLLRFWLLPLFPPPDLVPLPVWIPPHASLVPLPFLLLPPVLFPMHMPIFGYIEITFEEWRYPHEL